jgi:hypothetical protein
MHHTRTFIFVNKTSTRARNHTRCSCFLYERALPCRYSCDVNRTGEERAARCWLSERRHEGGFSLRLDLIERDASRQLNKPHRCGALLIDLEDAEIGYDEINDVNAR